MLMSALARPLIARCAGDEPKGPRKLLFFSRSVLFEHPVIRREGGRLSFAEKTLVQMARQIDCTVDCTKDGRVFERSLDDYAAALAQNAGGLGPMLARIEPAQLAFVAPGESWLARIERRGRLWRPALDFGNARARARGHAGARGGRRRA